MNRGVSLKKEFKLSDGRTLRVEWDNEIVIYLDGAPIHRIEKKEAKHIILPGYKPLFKKNDKKDIEFNVGGVNIGINIRLNSLSLQYLCDAYENGILLNGSDNTAENIKKDTNAAMKFLIGWAIISLVINFFLTTLLSFIISAVLLIAYIGLYFQVKKEKKWASIAALVIFLSETIYWFVLVSASGVTAGIYVPIMFLRMSIISALARELKIYKKNDEQNIIVPPVATTTPSVGASSVQPGSDEGQQGNVAAAVPAPVNINQNIKVADVASTPELNNRRKVPTILWVILTVIIVLFSAMLLIGYTESNKDKRESGKGTAANEKQGSSSEIDLSKIEILNTGYAVDDNGTMIVWGLVKNNTGVPIGKPEIEIKSYDDKGDVLCEGTTFGAYVMNAGEVYPFVTNLPTNSIWELYYEENYVKDTRTPINYTVKPVSAETGDKLDGKISSIINNKVKIISDEPGVWGVTKIRVINLELSSDFPADSGIGGVLNHAVGYDSAGKIVAMGSIDYHSAKQDLTKTKVVFPRGELDQATRFEYFFDNYGFQSAE